MIKKRKRKLDPKIIRVGDTIKILDPQLFIRCGYPLCLRDMKSEVEKSFENIIEDLIYSVGRGNQFMQRNDKGLYLDQSKVKNSSFGSSRQSGHSREYYKILRELASVRIKVKNFGGNDRKIYTEKYEMSKDKEALVAKIKFVKTGLRVSGSSSYDNYSGHNEYDPPYLEGEKTHKILELDLCRGEIESPGACWEPENSYLYDPIMIESIYVEKTRCRPLNEEEEFHRRFEDMNKQ